MGTTDRPEVVMMRGEARAAAGPLRRLARLLVGPNKLRRSSDRIEGAVLLLLTTTFLAAVVAAPFVGASIYESQREATTHLHPAVAVLSRNGPAETDMTGDGQVSAYWQAPDGRLRSGILTSETAPSIWGQSVGARVEVWLTESGQPAAPPPAQAALLFSAIVIAFAAACGVGIVLIICYWLCRLLLDRRRLAGWEAGWRLIGPRWTTHR
jgi:hypothetical protein